MEQPGKLEPIRLNPPFPESPDHAYRPQRSKILLMGGGTALAVFLLLAGLVIFILATHEHHIDSGALVTSAPLGKTLAMTSAVSTIISGTVPLLLVLESYRIASMWLIASGDGGTNRPTPYQLGLLMTVLSNGNLPGLWKGAAATVPDAAGNDDTFVGDTGFFVHGHSGSFNVISCSVAVQNVKYEFSNGSYMTREQTMADLDTARRVAALSNDNIPTQLPPVVDGIGLLSGNYAASFSRELSREMVALSSQIWMNASAQQVFTVVPNVGSRFRLVPLGLFAIVMALYGLIALFLTFQALRATSAQAYASLARMRLMDPLTMINAAYGPLDASRTWKEDSKALFGVEGEQDRLNVGPTTLPDGSVAFGVSRAFFW
ncbi:hypothetical protein GGX14DRAFT_405497 [Mycena pura]|uniref:Uncharacterized protein n=1 Tax=Mycena pura TaxID=153505 RepID=A0AAD6US55_9AGAR|nr:hypothetical protein GGX14DRAFT_405497 [Mycena pura]